MSEHEGLPRRAIAAGAARSTGITIALVIVYYLVPIDGVGRLGTLIGLVVTIVVFGVALVWELRAIVKARFPVSKAVEAMATLLPLLLLLFAALYFAIEQQTPDAFSTSFDRTGSLYFTVTTFATVGYGDITPVSNLARVVAIVQMLVDLAVIGAVARIVVGAAQRTRARQTAEQDQPTG